MRPLSRSEREKIDRAFMRAFRVDAATSQGNVCAYCGDELTPKNMTADHVDPRANGGRDGRNNIMAACGRCNSVKGKMPVLLFQQRIAAPRSGDNIHFWLIWSQRRINARLRLFQERMNRVVGVRS